MTPSVEVCSLLIGETFTKKKSDRETGNQVVNLISEFKSGKPIIFLLMNPSP
jgi:hypothetical protein